MMMRTDDSYALREVADRVVKAHEALKAYRRGVDYNRRQPDARELQALEREIDVSVDDLRRELGVR